jgi:hypothetical protein
MPCPGRGVRESEKRITPREHWTFRPRSRPAPTNRTFFRAYCSGVNGGTASCPANGAYLVESFPLAPDGVTQAGPDGIAYYDALGRAIASDTQAFDASQWIRSETLYDSFGRVSATSRPFFLTGGTPALSVNAYLDPNCTGCTGLSNLTGDNPDSDCYGMCAIGPGNLAEAIANTRDTISHSNPGLTPTGKSSAGLTNDTTF